MSHFWAESVTECDMLTQVKEKPKQHAPKSGCGAD